METTGSTTRQSIPKILRDHAEKMKLARDYNVQRNLTDLGNAERFVDAFSDVVKYNHGRNRWCYWNEKYWQADDMGIIVYLGKLVTRSIYAEAQLEEDEFHRKRIATWAKTSEANSKIKAMLDLAKNDPEIAVTEEAFNQNRDILNVNNGIVKLQTGELLPHDPAYMCSKIAPVDFKPQWLERDNEDIPAYFNNSELFFPFLAEITVYRQDLVYYLQRLFGYAVTGYTVEQAGYFLVGNGENGKGVLTSAILNILGDYAQAAPPDLLIETKYKGGPTPEMARLAGARLVKIEETEDGDRLNEPRFKWLTGSDRITARGLHENYFEFDPQFTPIISTNHKPRITTGGHAVWRRIRVLPFDYQVDSEHKDKQLAEKIKAEYPAVLAWIIEGAVAWYQQGFPYSETVEAATEEYRRDEDKIGPFLEECTRPGTGSIKTSRLYKLYRDWCQDQGDRAMSNRRFHSAMRERGYTTEHVRNGDFYVQLDEM